MNVFDPTLVIVRGINSEWFAQNFTKMWVGFGDAAVAIPKRDANYVGFYVEAPISAITHIGIVSSIDRYENGADFYLKAIVKLEHPIKPGHQIRKHEYWNLQDFGLSELSIIEKANSETGSNVRPPNSPIYFSSEAISCYLFLSDISFNNFLLTEAEYSNRLKTLPFLIGPSNNEYLDEIQIRLNEIEGLQIEEENFNWNIENVDQDRNKSDQERSDDDSDPSIFFLTTVSGKLSKWEFHKGDSDFFPSIPHGHSIDNHKVKLDAYLGFIYKNNLRHDRESRQYIVDLWNDEKFRKFARENLNYYLATFPKFNMIGKVDNI
jgi:hypothetical protein